MRSAVAAALGLNLFNRQAAKLYMCNIAQIANVLQSLLITDGPEGTRCVRTTTYFAFRLFKPHRGNTSVHVDGSSEAPNAISVSASKTNGKLIVSLVNSSDTEDITAICHIRGVTAKTAAAQILHHADRNAANSFDAPETIIPQTHPARIEGDKLILDLPPLSVSTVTVETA